MGIFRSELCDPTEINLNIDFSLSRESCYDSLMVTSRGGIGFIVFRHGTEQEWLRTNNDQIGFALTKTVLEANKDSVYVNIGAWAGDTTIFGARYAKKTVAVEANPYTFDHLKYNEELNQAHIGDVLLEHAYLSDQDATANICIPFHPLSRATCGEDRKCERLELNRQQKRPENFTEVQVPGMSITSLYTKYTLQNITLLKIDIEGGECNLFGENSQGTLQPVDQLLLELHPFLFAKEEFMDYIASLLPIRSILPHSILFDKNGQVIHSFDDIVPDRDHQFLLASKKPFDSSIKQLFS